ncbi:MAG: glycosyltransferase [Mucinivorans sp.]
MRNHNHIAFFVPSLNIGGVESVFLSYTLMLTNRGYDVDLVVCKPEGSLMDKVPPGVNLVHFNGIKLRKVMPYLRRYLHESDVSTLICGPDITNFIAIMVNLSLCKRHSVNLIVTQHSVLDNDTKDLGLLGHLIPLGKRLLYRFASHVVAVSDAVAKDLEQCGVPKRKIATIYNPINIAEIERFANEPVAIELPVNYLAFVGRLNSVKNVGLLIRAFELLEENELYLVIVGDGAMRCQWEKLAQQGAKHDRIIFTGSLSNPAFVIRGACAIAVPSFSEAFPMVVIEAAALGKTIAHTPNVGCVEILGNDCGYCSNGFNDPDDFANTLRKALKQPIEPERIRKIALALDESKIIPQLETLMQ